MVWQDYVIGVMTILFSIALVPQGIYGFKVKRGTILFSVGVITAFGLYVLAFTFATLGLYFSTGMNIVTGTLWMILSIQSIVYRKNSRARKNSP